MRWGVLVMGCLALAPGVSRAEAAFFAGIAVLMGDRPALGFTVKALNSRDEDHGVVGLGASYFPARTKNPFGVDLSVGLQGHHAAAMVGVDVIQSAPSVSVGYSDTRK